jgi:hypothetical protein
VAAGIQKGLAAMVALLLATAWQYRKNTPLLFVIIATLFGVAALIAASQSGVPEWIIKLLAVGWLICMLTAGVFGVVKLLVPDRRKTKLS